MLQTPHSMLPNPLPPFSPAEVDCAVAVMLKILDGKCKMNEDEKPVMEALYDALRDRPGARLDARLHAVIDLARREMDESLREHVYEQRLFAETMISRPVMKQFKARLRETGVLPERELAHA